MRPVARRGALALAGLLLVLAAAWAMPPRAYACSCAGSSLVEHFDRSAVVFTGEVVGEKRDGDSFIVTFSVNRVLKGAAGDRQPVLTNLTAYECGLELGGSDPFLVFADPGPAGTDQLWISACNGTRPLDRRVGPALVVGTVVVLAGICFVALGVTRRVRSRRGAS